MKREERLKAFKVSLNTLFKAQHIGWATFEANRRFVRFVGYNAEILVDMPIAEMTTDEEKLLLDLGVFSANFGRKDPKNGKFLAYRARYAKFELKSAALLIERIFTEVFKLSSEYDFKSNLYVGDKEVTLVSQNNSGCYALQNRRLKSNNSSITKSQNIDCPLDEGDINNLDGHQFESLIEDLVKKMGFIVEERKLTADGGVDILAHSHEPLFEGKYVIQCKRYNHKVSESPVRDLYGVVHSLNANKGILITNSTFTQAAINFARDKQLELIEGVKLYGLLSRYNLLKHKTGATLSNISAYLIYNYVPAMKKINQSYETIRNGDMYVERKTITEKEWKKLFAKTVENVLDFLKWWCVSWERFGLLTTEKPANIQKIKEKGDQIIKATQIHLNSYKTFIETLPPNNFSVAYKKFARCFENTFEIIFQIYRELDTLAGLSAKQLKEKANKDKQIIINYKVKFTPELSIAITQVYKEVMMNTC